MDTARVKHGNLLFWLATVSASNFCTILELEAGKLSALGTPHSLTLSV